MELQDLKSIWTKVVDTEKTTYQIDQSDVQIIIKKKSNILISKIKRELQFKRWLLGIIGSLTTILAPLFYYKDTADFFLDSILSRLEMSIILFTMGIILLIVFTNVFISYRKITDFQKTSGNLKITLQETIKILNRIIKFGIYSDALGVPFIVTWIFYRKLYEDEAFNFDLRFLYLGCTAIIVFIIKYYIGTYLQTRKYNPYINSLKTCLEDIDFIKTDSE